MATAAPRVVLVDDDADFLDINRMILEGEGFNVRCFSDPERAFQALAADPPDVVITDLMMGRLDSGFSLARRIKEDARLKDVAVIIVSGIAAQRGYDFHPREAQDLDSMKADAFLDKPVEPEKLIQRVRDLARRTPPSSA